MHAERQLDVSYGSSLLGALGHCVQTSRLNEHDRSTATPVIVHLVSELFNHLLIQKQNTAVWSPVPNTHKISVAL